MSDSYRIVFAGTPDFAARPLQALLDGGHRPLAVYTQPDRPAGRGRKPGLSPVKQTAQDHNLPVYQPQTFRDNPDALAELEALQPDLLIVVAYGLILPEAVLRIPRLGCINVHASLLPRWRGAAPIQRAIEAGDTESGITLMQMDSGLDTGPMISKHRLPLPDTMTGGELHDALADLGSEALVRFLDDAESALAKATAQPDAGITYARKLVKAEAQLDWAQPAQQLVRQIRAFNPWPVSWFTWSGQPVRVWAATTALDCQAAPGTVRRHDQGLAIATADGWLVPTRIQPSGKKAMDTADWLNGQGAALKDGEVLS